MFTFDPNNLTPEEEHYYIQEGLERARFRELRAKLEGKCKILNDLAKIVWPIVDNKMEAFLFVIDMLTCRMDDINLAFGVWLENSPQRQLLMENITVAYNEYKSIC